jgi:hypothetical protein
VRLIARRGGDDRRQRADRCGHGRGNAGQRYA